MPTFNLSQYQKLLEKVDLLEKTYSFNDPSFFKDPLYIELLSLEARVEKQVVYNHKNSYFDLIQKYLDNKISPYVFRFEFIKMINKDTKKAEKILNNFEELATFWIDFELDDFSSLFSNIEEPCSYLFEFEFEDEENKISETTFRNLIQKNFLKLQKYSKQ